MNRKKRLQMQKQPAEVVAKHKADAAKRVEILKGMGKSNGCYVTKDGQRIPMYRTKTLADLEQALIEARRRSLFGRAA